MKKIVKRLIIGSIGLFLVLFIAAGIDVMNDPPKPEPQIEEQTDIETEPTEFTINDMKGVISQYWEKDYIVLSNFETTEHTTDLGDNKDLVERFSYADIKTEDPISGEDIEGKVELTQTNGEVSYLKILDIVFVQ